MKKTKLILNSLLVLSVCVGCSSANGVAMASPGHEYSYILNNEENNQYLNFTENDFIETKTKNTSSFSLDSSTSSYSDIRRKITQHKNISQNENINDVKNVKSFQKKLKNINNAYLENTTKNFITENSVSELKHKKVSFKNIQEPNLNEQ